MKKSHLQIIFRVLLTGLIITLLSACGSGGGGGGGGGDSSSANSSGSESINTQWATTIVDNATKTEGFNASIAIDANDNLHVIHIDYIRNDLKYATNASGEWESSTIDNCIFTYRINYQSKGNYRLSIVMDSNNDAHISYECNGSIKYASNSSGTWLNTLIDTGLNPMIAIDSSDNIHISYMNRYDTFYNYVESKYATNISGSWESATVKPRGGTPEIVIDTLDNVHLIFMGIYNNEIIINEAMNTTGTWEWEEGRFNMNGSGMSYKAMVMDSEDNLHVTYVDPGDDSIRYATNRTGVWVSTIIDGCYNSDFIYCEGPRRPSIAVDSNDNAHISYYFNGRGSGSLKYTAMTSGTVTAEIVDEYLNMGDYSSIVVDSEDNIHISYLGEYNMYDNFFYLKYATNRPAVYDATGSWSYTTSGNWVRGTSGCTADKDETSIGNIMQKGKQLVGEFKGNMFLGSASGQVYELYTVYPENGGVTRIKIYLTMTSSTSASGTLLWFWRGNGYCQGGNDIIINKM